MKYFKKYIYIPTIYISMWIKDLLSLWDKLDAVNLSFFQLPCLDALKIKLSNEVRGTFNWDQKSLG